MTANPAAELPGPGETDPVARWRLLADINRGYGTGKDERLERMRAAMRRVHGLPPDADTDTIIAARDADGRDWPAKTTDYWDAYAAILAETGAARTLGAEPYPASFPSI